MTDQPDVLTDEEKFLAEVDEAETFAGDYQCCIGWEIETCMAAFTHLGKMLTEVHRLREMVRRLQEDNERLNDGLRLLANALENQHKLVNTLATEVTPLTSALDEARSMQAEVVELRALVKEWLCINCLTVYLGPPQKGYSCVQCPKCQGDTGPREWMEHRTQLADLQAKLDEASKFIMGNCGDNHRDSACSLCDPSGEAVRPDFVCAYHKADQWIARATEERVKKEGKP